MQFFSALADTGSLDKAFSFTFLVAYSTATNPTAVPLVQGLTAQAFWTASIFSVVYAPSFMRGKLAAYEADLVPLAPSGEETIRKAFGGVSRLVPVLVVSVLFGLFSAPYTYFQTTLTPGAVTLGYVFVSNVLISLLFGSFIWVYFRSLWGLYKLGNEPLRLAPHEQDPMLGVKPIGSMSFTLFLSYSAVVGFITLGLLVVPDTFSLVSIFVLELLGGVMFFLPLNSVHKKMLAQKREEKRKLVKKLSELAGGRSGRAEGTEDLLRQIREVQILQVQKDYVSTIPTWPFDTGILSRFAAIILSVIAILLSRIISVSFHL